MRALIESWKDSLDERSIHPTVAMAAMNLDFLCIHPFRDGNGRVSRLLLLLQCYHLGYEVGRYISLERLIEENKSGITKPSNKVRKVATKASMIHGHTSTTFCTY